MKKIMAILLAVVMMVMLMPMAFANVNVTVTAGSTFIKVGDTVTLTASSDAAGATYEWTTTGGSLTSMTGDAVGFSAAAAGTYTVTATATAGEAGTGNGTVTITVTDKTITTKPTANTNLVYTGEVQRGVNEGTGYTLTNATGTLAVGYDAIATLSDGYIWSDNTTAPITIHWTIAKKSVALPEEKTLPYTGAEQTAYSDTDDYTVSGNTGKEIGDYTLKATLKNPDNTAWASGDGTVAWHIGKGKVEVPSAVTGLIYNKSEQTGVLENDKYTLTDNKKTDAGSYTATAALKDKTNYEWTTGGTDNKTIEWSIAKAKTDVPTATSFVYDGTEKTGVATSDTYTISGTSKATTAGTYSCTVTPTSNYTWQDGTTEAKTLTWKIATPYTVTFNPNGGSVSPVSAKTDVNGKVTLPTATRTGYTFNGWYTAASGGAKLTSDAVYTADTTIYAQWTAQQNITVTIVYTSGGWANFSYNGASYTTTTVPYGSKVTVYAAATNTSTSYGNFVYDMWINGSQKVVFGSSYTSATWTTPELTSNTTIKVRFGNQYGNPYTGDTSVLSYVVAMSASAVTGAGTVIGVNKIRSKKKK